MKCSVPGCGKPSKTRGWCQAHYARWLRNGDPTIGSRFPGRLMCDRSTHGETGTPTYISWIEMHRRCRGRDGRTGYVERGITVCERWADFSAFLDDMGPRPSPEHTIDRIDNDGGYSPANCRWATKKEQSNNRRSNRVVEYRGALMSLSDAISLAGNVITQGGAWRRLQRGWDVAAAVETPSDTRFVLHKMKRAA